MFAVSSVLILTRICRWEAELSLSEPTVRVTSPSVRWRRPITSKCFPLARYSRMAAIRILRKRTARQRRNTSVGTAAIELKHLAEDVLENAAVLVVGHLFGRVHADERGDRFYAAIRRFGIHRGVFTRRKRRDAFDIEHFVAGQAEGIASFAGLEFQRQHSHPNQIASINAFVAFRQNRAA